MIRLCLPKPDILTKVIAGLMILLTFMVSPVATAAGPWDVGPAVGATVPALHAIGLNGSSVGLRELSGKNGLVLVFFRSAKWCPYCQKQLIDLKETPGPLAERGYQLAAISYDSVDVLKRFTAQRGIPFPLLSDVGSATIDAWKLRDLRYKPGSEAWGVPYASIFVLSPGGVLRAKLAEEDFKVRPTTDSILATIDQLPKNR